MLNWIRIFPFFISFFCWNKINKESSIKEYRGKMESCKTNHILDRSSHQWCSVRKGILRNFAKFTRKHICQRFFFNKVAGLSLIIDNLVQVFLCEFCKFLKNTSGRLLLFRVNRVSDDYARSIYIKVNNSYE